MYTLPCPQCGEEHPRSTYRKRGGGVHKTCVKCRTKEYHARYWLKKKVTANLEKYKVLTQQQYIAKRSKELKVELSKASYDNRRGIDRLQSSRRPTKATVKNLEIRLELQRQWEAGLMELLERVSRGEQVPSLREYMGRTDV